MLLPFNEVCAKVGETATHPGQPLVHHTTGLETAGGPGGELAGVDSRPTSTWHWGRSR